MPPAVLLTEADLHGLVDGCLDPGRRADAQRRLSASPADRARVEAWQEQNDLIRRAFSDVDREPLPVSLVIAPPAAIGPIAAPRDAAPFADPRGTPAPTRLSSTVASLLALLLMVGGLGGSWMLLQSSQGDPPAGDPVVQGSVDETLADQAAGAVEADRRAEGWAHRQAANATGLPTSEIPDLSPAGFVFTNAEARTVEPRSIVFHYRGAASDRVVVTVARATSGADKAPSPAGSGLSWHHGASVYVIAGTVRPERLRALATMLQGDDTPE